ncbi:MAG: TatD family hydrolase [Actinomycetota bacterium]|nr:TatD family hydrolase [Actinomycetota bacterium]
MGKKKGGLTDSHAHLDFFGSDSKIEKVLARAVENDVTRIITIADSLESSYRAVELAQKHSEVYAAVGVHPHNASDVNPETLKELERLAKEPKVVAIGEIGLDYHKNHSPHLVQQKVFEQQLELAKKVKLPVIVHDRDADADVMGALIKHGTKKGVFHCFSGDLAFAEKVLAMNFYISIAGTVTFKNAGVLAGIAKFVPLTKLLVETDSPYLTPHPYRGRKNEPAYVRLVAEKIAELKEIDVSAVEASTQENIRLLFGIA